ncbi:MAG: CHAT domain-containing protein, partial [Myxococcota bacterium]
SAGRPPGAMVVGLGTVGRLTPRGLRETVRDGVLRYLLEREEQGDDRPGLSFLLLGSVGSLSIRDSVRAIVAGCLDADERVAPYGVRLAELELIELYEDAALEAHGAAQQLGSAVGFADRGTRYIEPAAHLNDLGDVQATRPSEAFHIAWPHRVLVKREGSQLQVELLTQRAATERTHHQPPWAPLMTMIDQIRASAGSPRVRGRDVWQTLFATLVPPYWQAVLREDLPLQLVLDDDTAQIPWERLEDRDDPDASRPLSVRFSMTRQLSSAAPPTRPRVSKGTTVLVAGDFETGRLALPGARSELQQLTNLLGSSYDVDALIGPQVRHEELLACLRDPPPRFVHIAAHGRLHGDTTGIVLPGDEGRIPSLNGVWLAELDPAPEVAFLNCCHSGAFEVDGRLASEHGNAVAIDLARALISAGTTSVVVAGWPVADQAARAFAVRFWEEMLRGVPLGEAVLQARRYVWTHYEGTDTWAAYQVYGDGATRLARASSPRFPGSPTALSTYLGELAFRRRSQPAELARHLERLEQEAPTRWWSSGPLGEAFGDAWLAALDPSRAVVWFDRAVSAEQGTFRGAERLLHAWTKVLRASDEQGAAERFEWRFARLGAQGWVRARKGDADLVRGPATAYDVVKRLVQIQPTSERHALLASAIKYQASRKLADAQDAAAIAACRATLEQARKAYLRSAEPDLCPSHERFYPLLVATGIAVAQAHEPSKAERSAWQAAVQVARTSAESSAPDFWNAVSLVDADLIEALIDGQLANRRDALTEAYRAVRPLASSAGDWVSSVDFVEFLSRTVRRCSGADEVANELRALRQDLRGLG